MYPRLGILANVGLVAAGAFTKHITQVVAAGQETWGLQVIGYNPWGLQQALGFSTET